MTIEDNEPQFELVEDEAPTESEAEPEAEPKE